MRPNIDETFLKICQILAERRTCARRKVGCVLVNSNNHILATGYNGVASGMAHCIDTPCPGSNKESGSSTSLYLCEAIHAEQNALLQCRDVQSIYTCYITCSPCIQCTKLLLQTSCERICFLDESSHNEEAKKYWQRKNPDWWLKEVNPNNALQVRKSLQKTWIRWAHV